MTHKGACSPARRYGRYPLTIVRGEGCKLFDSNGCVFFPPGVRALRRSSKRDDRQTTRPTDDDDGSLAFSRVVVRGSSNRPPPRITHAPLTENGKDASPRASFFRWVASTRLRLLLPRSASQFHTQSQPFSLWNGTKGTSRCAREPHTHTHTHTHTRIARPRTATPSHAGCILDDMYDALLIRSITITHFTIHTITITQERVPRLRRGHLDVRARPRERRPLRRGRHADALAAPRLEPLLHPRAGVWHGVSYGVSWCVSWCVSWFHHGVSCRGTSTTPPRR